MLTLKFSLHVNTTGCFKGVTTVVNTTECIKGVTTVINTTHSNHTETLFFSLAVTRRNCKISETISKLFGSTTCQEMKINVSSMVSHSRVIQGRVVYFKVLCLCVYACVRACACVCVCARARALFITWKGLVIKYEYLYIIAVLVNSLECCINYYLLT